MARAYHAELTVLHVYPMSLVIGGDTPSLPPNLALHPEERQRLLAELEAAAVAARSGGVTAHVCLLEGDPSEEILRYSRITKMDLLVIGTHGRRGFDRWILGSVAERVVQKARCAVLTVPPGDSDLTAAPERIVCPLELVDSEPTLDAAFSMARAFRAELLLVHVLTDLPPLATQAEGVDWPALAARLEEAARHRLSSAVALQEASGVSHQSVVVSGKPYREILKVADARHASLIVMGIHGSSPIERMFFGSTALQVLRLARCPVLTVRPPEVTS
jgi:nucleotide-binding universal stress UspA family protein